jgi:hypothetical protein
MPIGAKMYDGDLNYGSMALFSTSFYIYVFRIVSVDHHIHFFVLCLARTSGLITCIPNSADMMSHYKNTM